MSFCGLRTFFRSPARVASKILCLRRRTSSSDSAQSVPFAFLADTVRADGPAHAAELPEPVPCGRRPPWYGSGCEVITSRAAMALSLPPANPRSSARRTAARQAA
ncbi:hypothetical protein [Streptomyces sp. NPDC053813]|uniref:hypothetical protein n=1 Tax=Streptomyces sp. NPDC053813 TaxID=3365717 RepID=UPI0037CD1A9C